MRGSLLLKRIIFRYVIGMGVFVLLLVAGLYAYLGTFSRYGGDDYCEAARVKVSSPLGAVLDRYFDGNWPRATMRYSNLLFVGFSELLGKYKMQITMTSMVLLWFAGSIWWVYEIRKLLGINWCFLVDLFLGLTFGSLCLKQAPDLFETVYWRSAMMTHFAPLVFGLFLFSLVTRQARWPDWKIPSLMIYFFILFATYIVAGFSEPPTTTILTASPLFVFIVWLWDKSPARRQHLTLLSCVFMGAFFGLLTMLLSPATANSAQERTLDIIHILMNSFLYAYFFLVDSFKTQPLPLFLSGLIPLLLIWMHRQAMPLPKLSHEQKIIITIVMAVIPFWVWLLIAAGFSPSVYGQSYPVARMRFLARSILIAGLMLEGALSGLLLGTATFRSNPMLGHYAAAVLFAVIIIGYPMWTTVSVLRFDLPQYQNRAEQWDIRDIYIRKLKNDGEQDLVVPFLPSEIVQDLGDHKGFRLNRCASILYGVNSIVARPAYKINP